MKHLIGRICLGLSLAISGRIFAQERVLGEIAYGGSGCPAQSASLNLQGDLATIELSEMYVEAGSRSGRRIDRKACSLAVPVMQIEGLQVGLLMSAHGRGYLRKGMIDVSEEVFFSGELGPKFHQNLTTHGHHNIQVGSPDLDESEVNWSECGKSTILRMNLSLLVSGEGSASIEQLPFRIVTRECQ